MIRIAANWHGGRSFRASCHRKRSIWWACPWFASMTFDIRSRAACAQLAYPPKIVNRFLATVITQVPMWAACSNRRIFFSTAAARRACYASPRGAADLRKHSGAFHGKKKEYLVLRAKSLNRRARVRSCG